MFFIEPLPALHLTTKAAVVAAFAFYLKVTLSGFKPDKMRIVYQYFKIIKGFGKTNKPFSLPEAEPAAWAECCRPTGTALIISICAVAKVRYC